MGKNTWHQAKGKSIKVQVKVEDSIKNIHITSVVLEHHLKTGQNRLQSPQSGENTLHKNKEYT